MLDAPATDRGNMNITIYHNPDCGTSRNTLAIIEAAGLKPQIIEYLKTPPSRERLVELLGLMNMRPRDLLREKGTPFKELGLDDPALTDEGLIDAMMAHPALINRPIVVTDKGASLCRPSDIVLELLPEDIKTIEKEEGAPLLRAHQIKADDALVQALADAGLPTDDLSDAGSTWFRFAVPEGETVGYGGFELYGNDALLRSIVVLPDHRERGIGRNLMLLLMRKAFDAGARTGYVLTNSADGWLEKLAFKAVERADAPQAILDTRQANELCPKSATLRKRSLRP
ncbi:arsenate reductase (glutaredoxin) [Pseudochelatococcus sp. G4_1912]|uniref:arsenate reductase (glutaredoxin) n=1 Tax=Pseudochelatococcus sp. G4_1912 TaxID=3114288 RepID=UPI0039C644EA